VYLHYVLDLWADWWRKRFARGDVIIVRFADDFIVGFEEREDAERFLAEMRERFAKFSLELHPGKTRLIEFGRHAARRRAARGEGKPETFAFLGFTHICATSRRGRFWVRRKTDSKRMRAKLKMVKDQLRRRRYQPIPEQGRWLAAVVRGHQAYYAVPGNNRAVMRYISNEPFGLKLAQCFPYGNPRYSKKICQFNLVELLIVCELAVIDCGSQCSGQIIGYCPAFTQPWVPLHPLEFMGADFRPVVLAVALIHRQPG
jgi:hypothetical protein